MREQGLSPLFGFNVCSPQNRFALCGFYRHQEDGAIGNAGLIGFAHLISGVALERSPFFRQPRILGVDLLGTRL